MSNAKLSNRNYILYNSTISKFFTHGTIDEESPTPCNNVTLKMFLPIVDINNMVPTDYTSKYSSWLYVAISANVSILLHVKNFTMSFGFV